jgi:hypothetical protein
VRRRVVLTFHSTLGSSSFPLQIFRIQLYDLQNIAIEESKKGEDQCV